MEKVVALILKTNLNLRPFFNLYYLFIYLFFDSVLRRLATLISTLATLEASHEAICKQAKGASEQAKKLLDENEKLRVRGCYLLIPVFLMSFSVARGNSH